MDPARSCWRRRTGAPSRCAWCSSCPREPPWWPPDPPEESAWKVYCWSSAGGDDSVSFLVCLRYMSYYRYPQLTYIEYPVMIVQDIILCLLVLHFNGKMKHALPYTVIFVAGWYAITLQEWILDLSMNLSTVVSAASKLAQLRCLWQTRDSEQVSATTWGLAIYTCAARIFTTLMTTKDFTVLICFVVMMALNIWVITTILEYRKAKKQD
ncbi:putative PQ-loop repeat-containing protein [Naja naja]|nr:putative PQ-loop repeat-containing protein [Naja naja]